MNELTTGSHQHGDLDRTRTALQRAAYEQTIGKGVCPFCGTLPDEILEGMIYEGVHWRVWHNPFPYSGHSSHIMIVPREHWTQPDEQTPEAVLEWYTLVNRTIAHFNLPGGGLVLRFGSHEYKGGSITHLHWHIQVPDRETYAIAVFFADEPLKQFFKQGSSA